MAFVKKDKQKRYPILPIRSDEELTRPRNLQFHVYKRLGIHDPQAGSSSAGAAQFIALAGETPENEHRGQASSRGQAGSRGFLVRQIKRIGGFLVGQIKRIGNFLWDFIEPHTPVGQDEVEKRKRCIKYSEKAVILAITFFVYLFSASSSTGNMIFRVFAYVALFIALLTDLVSYKISLKQGHVMVYLSSSSLGLTALFIFISFKIIYGLTVIFVLLIIVAILLEHKWATGVRQQSTDEELDHIFDSAALFLGSGSLITILITGMKGFKHVAGTFVGFFFFSIVLLAIYLMALTTVRTNKALLFRATQLDTLLLILFLAVLVTSLL